MAVENVRGDPDRELREFLERELNDDALAAFDATQKLWDSGKMDEMIESGDFSEMPPETLPDDPDAVPRDSITEFDDVEPDE